MRRYLLYAASLQFQIDAETDRDAWELARADINRVHGTVSICMRRVIDRRADVLTMSDNPIYKTYPSDDYILVAIGDSDQPWRGSGPDSVAIAVAPRSAIRTPTTDEQNIEAILAGLENGDMLRADNAAVMYGMHDAGALFRASILGAVEKSRGHKKQ